jgi:hypothetical protein
LLRHHLKQAFLLGSKWSGLFLASRWITRGSLRILCYHGTAVGDVAQFRPQLFIAPSQLQFEAEVNGYLELIRRGLKRLRRRSPPPVDSAIRSPRPEAAEAVAASSRG